MKALRTFHSAANDVELYARMPVVAQQSRFAVIWFVKCRAIHHIHPHYLPIIMSSGETRWMQSLPSVSQQLIRNSASFYSAHSLVSRKDYPQYLSTIILSQSNNKTCSKDGLLTSFRQNRCFKQNQVHIITN